MDPRLGRLEDHGATLRLPVTAPAAPNPTTPAPTPGHGDGPPFNPPGRDLTGSEAHDRIKAFFADFRFTRPVGWPARLGA